MKNVLLVDTNFSSNPIYEYLVKNKYKVFIIGGRKDDFMAKSCVNYIHADYSDEICLGKIIKEYKIDYIVPGSNDLSYEICSRFSEENFAINIDNTSIIIQLFNKKIFRDFSEKNNIPVPKTYSKEYIKKEKLKNQIIVKPVDSFSGKGITLIKSSERDEELESAIQIAEENSRNKQYIIEEFVTGQLYSHSAFIEKKKIINDFFVKEYASVNPFVVDTSFVCFDFDNTIANQIRGNIEKIADMLNLSDGLVHTQFILNQDNFKYWLIEITRRCPGDLYSKLIEYSTGFPYSEKYTSYFLKNKTSEKNDLFSKESRNFIIRHTITQENSGIFKSILFNKNLSLMEYISIASNGEFLQPSPKGRVGIFFIQCIQKNELQEITEEFMQRKIYKINFLEQVQ